MYELEGGGSELVYAHEVASEFCVLTMNYLRIHLNKDKIRYFQSPTTFSQASPPVLNWHS